MAILTLNCPTCRKRLTHIPLDGLTLHYRCDDHGLLVLRPLVVVKDVVEDEGWCHVEAPLSGRDTHQVHTHDAA